MAEMAEKGKLRDASLYVVYFSAESARSARLSDAAAPRVNLEDSAKLRNYYKMNARKRFLRQLP